MDSCKNCRYARWEMTKGERPRINPNQPGRCIYRVVLPLLPKALNNFTDELPNRLERMVNPPQGAPIWSKDPCVNCPTWERKETF